jgi:octaprenyl-diphosphate synthase
VLETIKELSEQAVRDLLAAARDFSLERALAPVQDDIHQLNSNLSGYLPSESRTSKAIVDHVFASGGKRIRPALYFFVSRMLGYRGPHLYPIAAVAEFVHAASLLHDDVIDNSTLRRNKPTANSIWGDQAAVLTGDLIYARASEMMAETGSLEIVSEFARAIRLMSEGELIQLENVFNANVPVSVYLKILDCKTAVLIAAACRSAGVLGGADLKQRDALSKFGQRVGVAFQLIDDALDYLNSREKSGKPTLADLREGKVTMPVIMLRDLISSEERRRFEVALATEVVPGDEIEWIASLVERHGTAVKTIEMATRWTLEAVDCLSVFSDSVARRDLEALAMKLVRRFN